MTKYIFIKYYYTSNDIGQIFEQMQVEVEDQLENHFESDIHVFLHFIDCSTSAYFSDFMEVTHTFDLSEQEKNDIFKIVKREVAFYDDHGDDEDDKEIFDDIYDKNHYLAHAVFTRIDQKNLIVATEE